MQFDLDFKIVTEINNFSFIYITLNQIKPHRKWCFVLLEIITL